MSDEPVEYDDEDEDEDAVEERLEAAFQRALDEPMPDELRSLIADAIEPQTQNAMIDHGEVTTCIKIAYPLILDYLREHPEELTP